MYSPTFNFPAAKQGDPLLEASHGSAILDFPRGSSLRSYVYIDARAGRYLIGQKVYLYISQGILYLGLYFSLCGYNIYYDSERVSKETFCRHFENRRGETFPAGSFLRRIY